MKIVSHLELPGLAQKIAQIAPGVELLHLPADEPVSGNLRADALLTSVLGGDNLPQILRPAHGIRWVHVYGTGVDQFPVHAVRHAELTCSRGASSVAIAEWTMAMILSAAKRLPDNWLDRQPEHWYFADTSPLQGKCLGFLGFGSIAQQVARRAQGFDMRLCALVRRPRQAETENGVTFVDNLSKLLACCDHLVLAAPATPATHHILNRDSLARARPGLHIVNVARGSLLDQEALRVALDQGPIGLASLDVVEPEPLPAGHWLYQHPKVRLSPHISWNSPGAVANMESTFLDNLARFVEGRPLLGVVDSRQGY